LERHEIKLAARRVVILVASLWLLVGVLSWLFVFFFLPLPQGGMSSFSLAWGLVGLVLAVASTWLVWIWLQPVVLALMESAEGELQQQRLRRAAVLARSLHWRVGIVGLVPIVALPASAYWAVGQSLALLALGLCDSLLLAVAGMLLVQKHLRPLLERLAELMGGSLGGRVLSLRFKLAAFSFALAVFPTLLVGVTSFANSRWLLAREMGRNLSEKLGYMTRDVASLAVSGLGRTEVEAYLNDEANKLSTSEYVHLGRPGGEFYHSRGARPLEPGLYERIMAAARNADHGVVADPGRDVIYAFATSPKHDWISLAPVRWSSIEPAVVRLKVLMLIITVFAMTLAVVVGSVFADQQGSLIRRMATITGQVARGDLRHDVTLVADDEVGLLGMSLGTMVRNLRGTVQNVANLASQVANICDQLLVKASAISTGAEVQARSVHETSTSVEEMNANIQSASDSLQSLAQYSQETAEAVQKLGENFNLMSAETHSLTKLVGDTDDVIGDMAAAVAQVSGNVRQLGEAAERTVMSVAEMDRSISEVSQSAADTALLSRQAIEVAQEGAVSVRRTIEGMERIVTSTRDTTSVILGLGNRIEAISGILGVIDEIADQTNLLALNAAIIAAQAGEHGRAFAVVADEIRSLAERTGSSTREIGQMIRDIQDTSETAIKSMRDGGATVNEGMSLAKQAGDALTEILLSFQKAVENVESIAANTEGQARTSESVARDTSRVADMASKISAAAQQLEQSGKLLQEAFGQTRKSTTDLANMVGQQAQENRQAIAAVAEINDATTRVNQALLEQSKASDGILSAIEQIREIAKNHARASQEMGEATQQLVSTSTQLKDEASEFEV